TPKRATDKPFLMPVEDVFSIAGRGTVATGRVERGKVKVGEEIEIVGIRPTTKTVITGIEMFRKLLDEGMAGDNIGALLRGFKREDVERGQVLAKPGSITPHTKFKAQVYVLTKEEGGRHTPFFNGYRPQFYFRVTKDKTSVNVPVGLSLLSPLTLRPGQKTAGTLWFPTPSDGVTARTLQLSYRGQVLHFAKGV